MQGLKHAFENENLKKVICIILVCMEKVLKKACYEDFDFCSSNVKQKEGVPKHSVNSSCLHSAFDLDLFMFKLKSCSLETMARDAIFKAILKG